MKSLQTRTVQQGIDHHRADASRVYTEDQYHAPRIAKSVELAREILGTSLKVVVELACGTADICGQLADEHSVYGYDCHPNSITIARERWPKGSFEVAEIRTDSPKVAGGNLLIMCEILEHLNNPEEIVKEWLPKFGSCIISHPIDGDLDVDLSGGTHCWSYSLEDYQNWFKLGGHVLQNYCLVPGGGYTFAIGWGRNELLCRA